tara:strand:- start:2866 stop:3015 length:150 start_codon:yes stop_codon:yes gene_type:complete
MFMSQISLKYGVSRNKNGHKLTVSKNAQTIQVKQRAFTQNDCEGAHFDD